MYKAVSPLFNLSRKVKPVDIVITWVDSTDSDFMSDREKYYESGDNRSCRFPDINNNELELETAILCIIKNIDWKGTIFIVTPFNQVPRCYFELKKIYHKIKVVFHEEIFPKHFKHALPIFNSHAVEANLHRIPKLSEKFLYFNDDMYVTKKINYSSVFDRGKIIVQPLEKPFAGRGDVYQQMWRNMWDDRAMSPPWHGFLALTKAIMSSTEKFMKKDWNRTICSRFRSATDIPPCGAAINWALKNGQGKLAWNPLVLYAIYEVDTVWTDKQEYQDVVCINNTADLQKSIQNLKASIGKLPSIEHN